MTISNKKHNKGKNMSFGKLCFDEGYTQVFLGYHHCGQNKNKILISLDEVRELTKIYGVAEKVRKRRRRELVKWLAKRYDVY